MLKRMVIIKEPVYYFYERLFIILNVHIHNAWWNYEISAVNLKKNAYNKATKMRWKQWPKCIEIEVQLEKYSQKEQGIFKNKGGRQMQ